MTAKGLPMSETSMIDKDVVDIIASQNVDIVLSVPCNLLAGIIRLIDEGRMLHVPVCRE